MLLLFFGFLSHVAFALQYIPILQSVPDVTAQISDFKQSAARFSDDSPTDYVELPVFIYYFCDQDLVAILVL